MINGMNHPMLHTIAGLSLILGSMTTISCSRQQKSSVVLQPTAVLQSQSAPSLTGNMQVASPAVIIYKMKKDYSRQVPVIMDTSRSRIVSYPAPSDIKHGQTLTLPTQLVNGYWLDNRGINARVAFLSYTYEEYSRMQQAPALEELFDAIIDKDPLLDIRECGRRSDYQDIVGELNRLILQNGW